MLPRFLKLYYQVLDESIINIRRVSSGRGKKFFGAKYRYDGDHDKPRHQEQDNYEESEMKENIPREKRYCIVKCKNPKLNFYEGDTYPKFEPIPMASRGWHSRMSKGDYFTIFPNEKIEDEEGTDTTTSFSDIDLDSRLLKSIEENDLVHPTPIQKLGIPKILAGSNVALTAETGCGKTYAFLIPLIQQVLQWKQMLPQRSLNSPLAIIMTPSKELTLQIAKVARQLTKDLDINIVKFAYGNAKRVSYNPPIREVDIIISTVGIMSNMASIHSFDLDYVRHVILDEADTLLDKSFSFITCSVLTKLQLGAYRNPDSMEFPATAQLTLNSATIPQNLDGLLERIIDPQSIIPVATGFQHQIKVPQKFLRLGSSEKPVMLLKIVKSKTKNKIPIIVFCNNIETCDFVSIFLKQYGINCTRLHKKMSLAERKGKIMEFQNGHTHVLTTTDAGSRGIDTTLAKDVINFEFPLITAEYIHRCGRVGRIGSPRDCLVYNFITRPLEVILTSKIEFAARKLKPIPMVDMLHNKYDEEGQFLSAQEEGNNVHELKWDNDGNDRNNSDSRADDDEKNEDKRCSVPQ
ncbi:probable ATP-dependent RNA helicase DDX28 [Copidosoma floridanum]|uniref:probable ATP-dependent RNA helicase DDX28 n=1 Tax=Copidosoma floridanum TaxID=29053 RepID=UPI0006C9C09C|nr:probable ATP-dependent RNA helicase DDX28 [Copidosoma floridanum]